MEHPEQPRRIRNETLRQSLRTFCEFTIETMKRSEPTRRELRHTTIFTDDGSLSHGVEVRPDWGIDLVLLGERMAATTEWKVAEEALRQDEAVTRHLDTQVGTANSRWPVNVPTIFRSAVLALVAGQDTPVFDEMLFNRIYSEIEEYFYTDNLHFRCLAILRNFEASQPAIDLGNGVVIKRLSASERSELFSGSMIPFGVGGLGRWDLAYHPFAIQCTPVMPKVIGPLISPTNTGEPGVVARNTFIMALSALRLFKVGGVGYEWIQTASQSWTPFFGGIQFSMGHEGEVDSAARYSMEEHEIPQFVDFWRFYRESPGKEQPTINLAIRRFNFAYGRYRPEDRLIDYSISLESLLLDEQQELRYRLALRGAALAGRNPEERQAIFELLSKAYVLRSEIVHGEDPPTEIRLGGETINVLQFANRVEDYLRSAIIRLVAAGQDVTQLRRTLDEKIIRG